MDIGEFYFPVDQEGFYSFFNGLLGVKAKVFEIYVFKAKVSFSPL